MCISCWGPEKCLSQRLSVLRYHGNSFSHYSFKYFGVVMYISLKFLAESCGFSFELDGIVFVKIECEEDRYKGLEVFEDDEAIRVAFH